MRSDIDHRLDNKNGAWGVREGGRGGAISTGDGVSIRGIGKRSRQEISESSDSQKEGGKRDRRRAGGRSLPGAGTVSKEAQ